MLWALAALTVAPLVGAWALVRFAPPPAAHHGELIAPQALPDVPLALADGTPFRFSQLRGKWILVMIDSGRCGPGCERKLYVMRQLRAAQGENAPRLERLWLLSDRFAPAARTLAPYRGTRVVRAAESGLIERFPARASAAEHIYLIDPLGNLMMRFPREPEPAGVIRDLARLLRASRVG